MFAGKSAELEAASSNPGKVSNTNQGVSNWLDN